MIERDPPYVVPTTPPAWMPAPPPCAQPQPCCCCERAKPCAKPNLFPPNLALDPDIDLEPRKQLGVDKDARGAILAGAAMVVFGEILSLFYVTSQATTGSLVSLVPVAGPAIAVFHDKPGPEWATPLLVATWIQAAGILVMSVAAGYLDDPPARARAEAKRKINVGAATNGRDGHVTLSVKF